VVHLNITISDDVRRHFFTTKTLNAMVQTDITQLSKECNEWRERLHSYRDEFNQLQRKLQHAAFKSLSKDQLTDLEHYQNQLHIQLINIHDLKQLVKNHDRRIQFEVSGSNGHISDDTIVQHEHLYEDYQSLEHTLGDLRNDFHDFIDHLQ
jgi:chromosome segregation ATPase